MSTKKENYKIEEVQVNELTKYVVRKKAFWIFWNDVKDAQGDVIIYETKRKAQAYINFLK